MLKKLSLVQKWWLGGSSAVFFVISFLATLFFGQLPPKDLNPDLVTRVEAEILAQAEAQVLGAETDEESSILPSTSVLVIPKIGLRSPIYVSDRPEDLNLGVWHEFTSSTPDRGGHTILTAHRWSYQFAKPFFYLDDLAVNDQIVVFWAGQQYFYQVFHVETVAPDDLTTLTAEARDQLTLYTCTPLFTNSRRLVVQARLVQVLPIFN